MGKTSRKVKNIFKSAFHRPTVHVGKDNILLAVLLICVIILAFMVRIFPILYSYPILKAFDPYIQYSLTQYIIENGYLAMFTWVNQQSWYPIGYNMYTFLPGTPYMSATLYHILHFFGVNISVWETCIIFPAVMGTASTGLMFFLGENVGNRKTGILAAFLLALSPAYLQRTVAGFFDNETTGIFFIILVLYFFVRALKNDSLISALIGGLALGALMCSWGAYTYIIDLLPLTALLLVLMKRYSRRLLIYYTTIIGVGFFIGTRFPVNKISLIYELTALIPIGMIGFLFLCELYQRWKNSRAIMSIQANWRKIIGYMLGGLIVLLGILWLSDTLDDFLTLLEALPFVGVSGRNLAVLNPLASQFITQSVGEHLPSPWSVYYYNLHVLLIILPIGFFFLFKRLREEDLLIILFGITTLYFSGSFIRLLLILAPAAALISAFGITSLLKPFSQIFRKKYILVRRRKRYANLVNRQSSVGIFALVGFLLILYSIHGIYTSAYQLSGSAMMPAGLHDWEETWSWMRSSLPPGTVVCSWWDYGYWITKAGNATSNADNGTINATQIALIGRMFMANDELESIKILKMLGSDYVLVHWGYYTGIGGDEGKWVWMLKIGYENPVLNLITYPLIIWDYYNEETGLPNGTFFQSTLWKMLTCGELYFPDLDAYSELQNNYLYSTFHYRLHTNVDARGDLWKDRYPFDNPETYLKEIGGFDHQAYEIRYNGKDAPIAGLRYFDKAFYSKNHLVKVYKINYELAALQAKVREVALYNNGISTLKLKNTGEAPFRITSIKIGDQEVIGTTDVLSGPSTNNVSVGDELLLRTTNEKFDVNTTKTVQITIQDLEDATLQNPYVYSSAKVKVSPTYNMSVIEDQTFIYSNETAFITIKNTNNSYIKISNITFDDITTGNVTKSVTFQSGEFTDLNGTSPIIINENETIKIKIPPNYMTASGKFDNLLPNSLYNITVRAAWENLSRVFKKAVISNTSCLTLLDSTVYGNETVYFSINNTGSTDIHINWTKLDCEIFQGNFITPKLGDSYETSLRLTRGQVQNFSIKWQDRPDILNLNVSEQVNWTIDTYELLDPEATNTTLINIINAPGYAVNIIDEAYANETLFVNVTNIGNYTVIVSNFFINNHPSTNFYPLQPDNVTNSINASDWKQFRVHTDYNLNYTDLPIVKVRTFEGAEANTSIWVNFTGNVSITDAVANFTGFALVNVSNIGDWDLVIKDFTIITQSNQKYLIESDDFIRTDGTGENDYIVKIGTTGRFNITLPSEISQATNLRLKINVTTWEGAYDLANLTWSIGIVIDDAYMFENGTIKFNVTNIGKTNVSLDQIRIIRNVTEIFNANSTLSNVSLDIGESKNLTITSNLVSGNFSKYALLNVSARYTASYTDLIYAVPPTDNGSLFILATDKNITIVEGFPYTFAFDNGTKSANDTVKITIMNSGDRNFTINSFELYNGSWIEFSFRDLNGVLSNQNYTLEPYDIVTFQNISINNFSMSKFIELNVSTNKTDKLKVRVNTTASVLSVISNITKFNTTADIKIEPNITIVDSNHNLINLTLTNYGPINLRVNEITIDGTPLDRYSELINNTIWNNWPNTFFTLEPGQTKMFWFGYVTSAGNNYTISVQTVPFVKTTGIFTAY
ncbi:MAG: STT3 domain-containing protein, partial [Promethearchaeota archaeon]